MKASQGNRPLTSKTVEAMRPGSPDRSDIGEYRGLRVSCGKGGTKTFFYRYKSPESGKLLQVKIGNFPDVSLADARHQLLALKALRQAGVCPVAEQKRKAEAAHAEHLKESEAEATKVFTLADLVELYLQGYIEDRVTADGRRVAGARKPKGQSEVRRTLQNDPQRALGAYEASAVTRQMVVDHIMSIVDRGANVQAGSVLRELSSAYEYAIGLGRLPPDFANPALLAKASLKQARVRLTCKRGTRVLSDDEIRKLLQWLPGSAYTTTQKNVLRFSFWTACRTGEVCDAKWSDIDLEKGTFHIRASKTGAERYVQLPHQAQDFLRSLRLITGPYLFPSIKTHKPIQQKQLSEQAWRMRQSGRMLELEHWTPHDIRRTVRTGLSRIQCPSEVAEAILGHARSGIEGTYDLHRYEAECREWLQRWADHLDALLAEDP